MQPTKRRLLKSIVLPSLSVSVADDSRHSDKVCKVGKSDFSCNAYLSGQVDFFWYRDVVLRNG